MNNINYHKLKNIIIKWFSKESVIFFMKYDFAKNNWN